MPSTGAIWTGFCRDAVAREALLYDLVEVGELSHRYFEEPYPIRRFDRVLDGRVILDPSVLPAPPLQLPRVLSKRERPMDDEIDRLLKARFEAVFGKPEFEEDEEEEFFTLEHVRVHGIEFRLFDPRSPHPSAPHVSGARDMNRISFVFVRSEEHPELDGAIVRVEDRDQCQEYRRQPLIRNADWYLTTADVYLRYYCERWTELFLAWVKYFHVPDLTYKIGWDPLPGWDRFCERHREYRGPAVRHASLATLKGILRAEVEKWRARCEVWDREWKDDGGHDLTPLVMSLQAYAGADDR